jgi:formylglycine-generating enzyme required for sulfatase activity
VEGYVTPDEETAILVGGDILEFTAIYDVFIDVGTIVIAINLDGLEASWQLNGPDEYSTTGIGNQTISDLVIGSYTITWETVEGYVTPDEETAILAGGETLTFVSAYIHLVPILSGSFVMGSPEDELGHHVYETQHNVTLTTDFFMSATEVTNKQYANLAQWAFDNGYCNASSSGVTDNLDGSIEELLDLDGSYYEISFSGSTFTVDAGKENYPVREVTWYGSVAYCDWLSLKEGLPRAYNHSDWQCNNHAPYSAQGYRLPTEAEWEYACRAGSTTAFANGQITDEECNDSVLDAIGWYCGNADYSLQEVAQLIPNSWGLYDMHGNIWEWCNDLSSGDYVGDETDPVGVVEGVFANRRCRGSGYDRDSALCRSARRLYASQDSSFYSIGFRFVRSTGL